MGGGTQIVVARGKPRGASVYGRSRFLKVFKVHLAQTPRMSPCPWKNQSDPGSLVAPPSPSEDPGRARRRMKRGKEAMAGSGDPGWAKLAGAHTDAHRERIRCSDGCLNRLIGPALGEIGDRWRDGESERGREERGAKESGGVQSEVRGEGGDDGESGKTERSAERGLEISAAAAAANQRHCGENGG